MNDSSRTFWSLIQNKDKDKEYTVKIPKIQRDYVQGRSADHVQASLGFLLDDIEAAIYGRKPLDLNFIYGKVVKNEFIPIDGQQRLTTLFLLHIFGWIVSENRNGYSIEIFGKFKYDTRTSTVDFLEKLVGNLSDIQIEDTLISKAIADEYWFRAEWLADPTVFSMLKVLDEIQARFNHRKDLLDGLLDGNIRFQFLETNKIGDEEDLYIKLNARGRLLSDFENLKSEIEEKLDGELKQRIRHGMDNAWRDYFWKLANRKQSLADEKNKQANISELFDQVSILFFHWYFYCKSLLRDNDKEKLRETTEYFRLADYNIDVVETMEELEIILNKLSDSANLNALYGDDCWLFDCLDYYGDNGGIIFETILKYWAFLLTQKHTLSNDDYLAWKRVITHLIENSEYSEKTFHNAIRSIYSLDEFAPSILASLSSGMIDPEKLPAINSKMVFEEIQKAALIESNSDWKPLIYEAEDALLYFKGQITALLDFSGEKISLFKSYLEKFKYIFDNNGIPNSNIFLWRRALLVYGDYSLRGDCFLINSDRPRYRSWRDLLNDSNDGRRNYFKQLVDDIDINADLNLQLQGITKAFSDSNDWRFSFIKTNGVMDYMGYGMFRVKDNRTLLVPGKFQNGKRNAEYRTYALYCILKEEGYSGLDEYIYGESSAVMGISLRSGKIEVLSKSETEEVSCIVNKKVVKYVNTIQEMHNFLDEVLDRV